MRTEARFEDPHITRISVTEVNGETKIVVPPMRSIGGALFMLAWLGGWTVGGGFALHSLYEGDTDLGSKAFLLFWLCAWACGEIAVAYALLWMFFGAEWATANRTGLRLSKVLWIIWRSKTYAAASINNLRWEDQLSGDSGRKSRVSFEYGAKTISFASECDAGEGKYIVDTLSRRLGLITTAGIGRAGPESGFARP